MTKIQNIGVLTSGGDAPGMNACIRAITRMGLASNYNVYGIYDGYNGLIDNRIKRLSYTDVSNIIQRGGTILGTARCERFLEKKYREKAKDNLELNAIDALVIIGGDGSFAGAKVFHEEFSIPYIGIPATIDNDISGTDYTIGFDTALNNIISAVDKIRDTASAHRRIFLVEVMGNNSGRLALNAALVTGAEDVFIPEASEDFEAFELKIKRALNANKSSIIIVSEGDEIGGAKELYEYLKTKALHEKVRVSVLGHIQRGGSPVFTDRKMAIDFGVQAVKNFNEGVYNKVIGVKGHHLYSYTMSKDGLKNKSREENILKIVHKLSIY